MLTNTNLAHLVFQETESQLFDIFDIPYYKIFERYLQLLGQDPRQKKKFRNTILTIVVISIVSIIIPTVRKIYTNCFIMKI